MDFTVLAVDKENIRENEKNKYFSLARELKKNLAQNKLTSSLQYGKIHPTSVLNIWH